MSGGTQKYVKRAQPQFKKQGHVTLSKKQHSSPSYTSDHGADHRYTPTPKPGSGPSKPRLESQDHNWTIQVTKNNERNDPKGCHDNRGQSPDSVFTQSSGSNRSGHGWFTGETGGGLQSSKGKFSQSLLDMRELYIEASSPTEDSSSLDRWGSKGQRRSSEQGTGSGDVHQGEYVKVKVADFKAVPVTGALTRNKYRSESHLFELEVEDTPLRWNERRETVPLNAPVIFPSTVHVRTLIMKKTIGMFGFILNCKPIYNDHSIPDSLRYFPHVESIVENSVAKARGLRCGDFVLEIRGQSVERGSANLCDSLIRLSGECLKLKVASGEHIKRTAVSKAIENTIQTTPGSHSNRFPPRTPVGYRSSMERRCNDARGRKHLAPTPSLLHRTTSTPNLAAEDDAHGNIYEELNEAISDHDPKFFLPTQGHLEESRPAGTTTRGRNDAANSGDSVSARSSWAEKSQGQRASLDLPPSLPPRSQPNGEPGGAGGRSGRVRRHSVGALQIELEETFSTQTRSDIKFEPGKTLAKAKPPLPHTGLPEISTFSGRLENGGEEFQRTSTLNSTRLLMSHPRSNLHTQGQLEESRPDGNTYRGRNDPVNSNNSNRPKQQVAVVETKSGAKAIDSRFAAHSNATPERLPNQSNFTTTRQQLPNASKTVPSVPPGVSIVTPSITRVNIDPIQSPPPTVNAHPGYSPSSAKSSVETPSGHSMTIAKTSANVKSTYIAPVAESTIRQTEVLSSDDEDDDPSILLAAIRSHPLIQNRRKSNDGYPSIRQAAPLQDNGFPRIRQVSPVKNRPPALLPKQKHGPPARSISIDELGANKPSPGGGAQERRSSETPSVSGKSLIENLRQIKPGIEKTGNTAIPRSTIPTNQMKVGLRSPAQNVTKPANRRQDNTENRLASIATGWSSRSKVNLGAPSGRFLQLDGVTESQSYSEERQEESVGAGSNPGQSTSSENVGLAFDPRTGKLVISGATVDESEIDLLSLPPPLFGDSNDSSGRSSSRVPAPISRVPAPTGFAGSSLDGYHGRDEMPPFSRKKSSNDFIALAEITSLAPPVGFDDIREEKALPPPPLEFRSGMDLEVQPEHSSPKRSSIPNTDMKNDSKRKITKNIESSTDMKTDSTTKVTKSIESINVSSNRIRNPLFSDSEVPLASKVKVNQGQGRIRSTSSGNNKSITGWSCADVGDWLRSIGLGSHSDSFVSGSVDGRRLCALTRNELIDLGVTEMSHRRDLERAVLKLKSQQIT